MTTRTRKKEEDDEPKKGKGMKKKGKHKKAGKEKEHAAKPAKKKSGKMVLGLFPEGSTFGILAGALQSGKAKAFKELKALVPSGVNAKSRLSRLGSAGRREGKFYIKKVGNNYRLVMGKSKKAA
jgi:hypothetical protein